MERELTVCKLYLMVVQGVRWDDGGIDPADSCTLYNGKGNND